MSLSDNVLAQMNEMRKMSKKPTALKCDAVSFDCLMEDLKPSLSLLYPNDFDSNHETRIFGLRIEICDEPNFEVV